MKTSFKPSSLKSITPDVLKAFSQERNEPAWVLELRLKALSNHDALPWPGPRDEKWKRLGLDQIAWDKIQFSSAEIQPVAADTLPAELSAFSGPPSRTNGSAPTRLFVELSQKRWLDVQESVRKTGVEWLSLSDALKSKETQLRSAWTKAVENAKDNKFLSLTLALANEGFALFIPKNQQLTAPLQSYITAGQAGAAQFPLNFVFVEDGAEAQVWEELIGKTNATANFISSYTSVQLGENAKASFYYLQHWDNETVHFHFQDVTQKAHSRYNAVEVSVGGKISRGEKTIHLSGANAENKVLGVLFGDSEQNFENWITQNHTAPKTTSDIQYRGALKGKSRSFFSGMVYIAKEGQQSDAYQSAKSMILSPEAKADAIPNLEILADDVKCSHGAAVGPVDEDQKYYLQTRGVSPDKAEDIIVEGFFEPVIAEVPSQAVQDRLRSFVESKLHV